MKVPLPISLLLGHLVILVEGINFPYEATQLTDEEVEGRPEIAFGVYPTEPIPVPGNSTCRPFPGDADWPSESRWAELNSTLGGSLVRPEPPAGVCYLGSYDERACAVVRANFANTTFHTNDPGSVISQWEGGNACLLPDGIGADGACKRGGTPEYVIKVSSVRDIQVGINWARNSGVRLIIKNTGHDFMGKSQGAGSLSIWTHNLKGVEYIPEYTMGGYTGRAARIAAGVQTFELNRAAAGFGITILGPGGSTVGVTGGYLQGGGHSVLTSLYGLAADQVLELRIVTADGRFVRASSEENEELFWAVRGGGGGTWGVVTSILVRAYPPTPVSIIALSFTNNPTSPNGVNDTTFWKAVQTYWAFSPEICDNGGIGYNFIRHSTTNASILTLTTNMEMANLTAAQTRAFAEPLFKELRGLGVNVAVPNPTVLDPSVVSRAGPGELNIGTARTATRLVPRRNFEDEGLLGRTSDAIKAYVEGGYYFHGIQHCPSLSLSSLASYPFLSNNSVLKAFRETAMHSEAYDSVPATGASIETQKASYKRFREYFQGIVDVSPDAGSYMNEADVGEPGFQGAFWGENYARLKAIKERYDPWGVFWVVSGVGSEGWSVRAPGGLPTGNGPLCRTGG